MAQFNRRQLLKAAGVATGGIGLPAALPAASATGPVADDRLVRKMIASFAQADATLTASFFAADAVWEEVPISLVLNGRQAIQGYLAQATLDGLTTTDIAARAATAA